MTPQRAMIVLTVVIAVLVSYMMTGPAESGGGAPKAPPGRAVAPVDPQLRSALDRLGKTHGQLAGTLKKQQALGADAKSQVAQALKLAQGAPNAQTLASIKQSLDTAMKDLDAQDKLGNFEIQQLMSQYNEAQTLASSVLKKQDDAAKAVIQKL
jgi:hypothetical protein